MAVALELATKKWKVALDDGKHKAPMEKVVTHAKPAGRVDRW